ncbi:MULTISPECIES: chloride channel protein [unclassified Streptococcus]|uniref:chloride channel protein n=1 Tax=unclassified Streptococcus TaxID=2608887 RepID=UPI001A9F998E|nr:MULTISPECIES: chloride channel protein [unclassified Streptococcus]
MERIVRTIQAIPYKLRMVLVACLLGLVSGLAGIFLHFLLELVEGLAFGQSEHQSDFLTDGVPPYRIGISLLIVGLTSALVWYFLQRKGKLLSIKGQMKEEDSRSALHFRKQLLHSSWQIVAVGAGAPIGKEGAPREIGALLAGPLAKGFDLSLTDRIFLIACGAGAGLAAVYQVPLTSVFFIFETLGIAFSLKRFVLAGVTTYIAAFVAGWVISDHALYKMLDTTWSLQVLWMMPILVLVLTPLAYGFARLTKQATAHRIKDQRIFLTLPLAFLFLAFLAQNLPHLLGNGRMVAQEVINGIPWKTALVLFVLKALVVLLTLWAGAYGGTLTPSFALGMAGASLITLAFGFEGLSTLLLIGAVCFLTVTLNAPFSATGLVIGFTGQGLEALPYLLLAAFLAHALGRALDRISWKGLIRPKVRASEDG